MAPFSRYAAIPSALNYPLYVLKYLPENPTHQLLSPPLSPTIYKYHEVLKQQQQVLRIGKDTAMLDQVVETVVVLVKCMVMTFIASIKALLPMGVLPRKSVKGQVVLITGSGSGLGRGMAVEFAKLGARVVLWDINEKGNLETKAMLDEIQAQVLNALHSMISMNT